VENRRAQTSAHNSFGESPTGIKRLKPHSWGGAMARKQDGKAWDTFDDKAYAEEKDRMRWQTLRSDLFVTGTNTGQLVNLDMIGNQFKALTYGPKWAIIVLGRNKIVLDLEEAMLWIKNYLAPANAKRLDKKNVLCQEIILLRM